MISDTERLKTQEMLQPLQTELADLDEQVRFIETQLVFI